MSALVQQVLQGKRRALARMLTIVENEHPGKEEALAALFRHTGRAWVVGVTGAPGTGKSSLVNNVAKVYRERGQSVGIVAVDPTSPFSGGAILGDRIRMNDLSGDPGVFIRSMATRGSLGGLANATRDAVRVMDAAGFDIVIVETVGAGQSEVDIVRTADTTIVVEAPGLGDDVQAIKAGILEIADILVVNKADRVGADQTVRGLRAMLELGHPSARTQFVSHHGRAMQVELPQPDDNHALWVPPVLKTSATNNEGLPELVDKIDAHRHYLHESGNAQSAKAHYIQLELIERLQESLLRRISQEIDAETMTNTIQRIQARELDPQTAVQELIQYLE